MPDLSIVIPTYNEEAQYSTGLRAAQGRAGAARRRGEIIFSVDPSTDGTEERIRELRALDRRVKMLRLSRRFGQPAATLAGMQARRATPCVVIDCDLQDPPELIGDMIERWREGFDVVYAQRRSRAGETLAKRDRRRGRLPRHPQRSPRSTSRPTRATSVS